ncbi:hypothetical protein [Clostridium sp. HV4-5-A1G]|uniref:hypothetical protein n=1 Tax=Clostridium sp. HV4-5-A1G TaxID=2004595 RepID=UPI00123AA430|nr:hypothetical protein [Clostridium sp. HV4-5-A1G]KAA8673374.1 hypothetical protein F3O63_08765 [Clostridium sp. HV4-5-A1G]
MKTYEIYGLLENMAIENRRNFSPLYVCKRLKTRDIKEVTYSLINDFKDILKINYEVECPNGDSDFIVDDISQIKDEMRICHHCGEKYIPDPKNIWLTFNFKDDFKDYVKKKKSGLMKALIV